LTIPIPITFADPSIPKDIVPSFTSFKDIHLFLSLGICVEQPLSTYHTFFYL